jgi:hypothetical protein
MIERSTLRTRVFVALAAAGLLAALVGRTNVPGRFLSSLRPPMLGSIGDHTVDGEVLAGLPRSPIPLACEDPFRNTMRWRIEDRLPEGHDHNQRAHITRIALPPPGA